MAGILSAHHVISNVDVLGRITIDADAVLVAADHFSERQKQKQFMSTLLAAWDLGLTAVELEQVPSPTQEDPGRKFWMPFGTHASRNNLTRLPFYLESSGTQGAFVLLSRLLPILETGGLAVIDEFENDLHPHMLEPILDLFANPKTNPKKAQLLFTCHAAEVLNLLNKAQVMLVEKDAYCESTAYRLDSVEGIRSDDNLYAKYMAGAYGGVPRL